ncbi:gliding motility-associated C-terminal domain-containing protein [Crocinitomix catalasitica]|nr:gliding motility-associated C-terminal domain-containing protein [Crocinitomix catalasitica]
MLYAQTFEWVTNAGGLKHDKGTKIVVDKDGNIYETGYYNEQATFGPFDTGFSYPSSKETYIAKMSPDGTYLWVKNATNFFDDRGLGLCLDTAGNVYVTGTCWGGLVWGSLNVYNVTSYTDQIYVVKLDPDGNEIWMKNAGVDETGFPYNDDHGQDLAGDSKGNIYVTGFLSNNDPTDHFANFDAIQITVAANDSVAFLAKLDMDGNWQWIEVFDGIYAHRDNAVAVDDDDNIYVTGSFIETSTFGTETLTSAGKQDIYVVKYDEDGNFLWVAQGGSDRSDRGNDICYGNDGYMYVAGEFRNVCNWGPDIQLDNRGGPGGRDIFVAKITKGGDWVWANQAGSKKGSDKAIGIDANAQGNIFVTGQYSANAKFDDLEIDSEGDSVNVFIAGIDTNGVWRWVMDGGGSDFDRGSGIAVDNCNIYVTGFFTNAINFGSQSTTSVLGKDIFTLKLSNVCFDYLTLPPGPPIIDPDGFTGFILPTAVSPNDDNNNDVLQFYVGSDVLSFDLKIFDRWGNMIFRTQTDGDFWDGTFRGKRVNTGIYTYVLDVNQTDIGKSATSGNITVIR